MLSRSLTRYSNGCGFVPKLLPVTNAFMSSSSSCLLPLSCTVAPGSHQAITLVNAVPGAMDFSARSLVCSGTGKSERESEVKQRDVIEREREREREIDGRETTETIDTCM